MNKTRQAILVALATSLTLPSIAEESSPIIVTATRTAQTVDASLASVTVITQKEIEQLQPNDLRDLLTSISGIDINNNGGLGKATSLFMRGTSSSHLLVMIDGIKIGSATTGSIAFQHIPVSQIERIEIVRGPRAALYGSEAIGGVIQIFTRKGKDKDSANFELSYGSESTSKISAGFSGKSNDTSYSLQASDLKTNGIDSKDGTETDVDGYNNTSAIINLSHKLSNTSSLDLNLMHASGETEFDSSFQNNSEFVQQTTGLTYKFAATTDWNMKLIASQSLDRSDSFLNEEFKSTFNTTRNNVSWQNDFTLSDSQLLTFGVDSQNDKVTSTSTYNESSRDNTAAFLQHQWTGEANDLHLAVRNDDNQAFGSNSTGSIAFGHQFDNDLRIISSYGTAFKAPTFNQLYFPGYGVSTVKPEESESYEVELRNKYSWGKWSVSFYHTDITNLIPSFPVSNIDKARIDGFELRLNTRIGGWDAKAELALLDPKDKKTEKVLRRRAQETFRLDMDKSSGNWKNGFSLIARGHSFDDAANTKRVSGYGIVNLRSQYKINKKLTLKGKVENLFDKEYETARTYNNPGTSVFISLSYQDF